MACQCITTPGGVIVCDDCASQIITALNSLIPGQDYQAGELPPMTTAEYSGVMNAVNGYFGLLPQDQEGEA